MQNIARRAEKKGDIMDAATRRDMLVGAGFAAVGAAAMGAGMSAAYADEPAAEEASGNDWMPASWDAEADLVIVGYGGAGGLAAIAAANAGSSSIILEKSPERDGGNTGCSTGQIHTGTNVDIEEWVNIYKHGSFGCGASEDIIRTYMNAANETPAKLEEYGIPVIWSDASGNGTTKPSYYQSGLVDGQEGKEGRFLFKAIDDVVSGFDNIDVRLATRAKKLVQNPSTKEIVGVIADDADGNELAFKAKKAVIMACGGYENNPEMQYNYNQPGVRSFAWGTIYNTGDGFPMVTEVGAKLWHMHALEHAAPCFLKPSEEADCSISVDATTGIQPANYIFVDYNGKRFMRDDKTAGHDMEHKPGLDFSNDGYFLHLPMFMIFDSTLFNGNPLWMGTGRTGMINTFAGVYNANHPDTPLISWTSNEEALEQGWIFKGETLEELAANIKGNRPCGTEDDAVNGIDAETLAATVEAYNSYCEAGEDPDFGRPAENMLPLNNPPYYAIEMGFSTINTQGGPERNEYCQVIGVDGQPIPRLYGTGEFGSYNGYVYNCGNILEALTTGRMAAEHAVTLDAWDE